MRPNILFIVIDSLRADRFFGKNKTCKTPKINDLLKSGTYFKNTFSSSDVTGTCLGNMFSGMYSFKTGITLQNYNIDTVTSFDILKNHGYTLHGMIPNLTWFNAFTQNFDKIDSFTCANLVQDGLNDGIGEKILDNLNRKSTQPWMYYIHLEDLHEKIVVPQNFSSNEFGNSKYDQQVSFIDSWLEKILEKINLNETIVIITSDHGDYVPILQNISHLPGIRKIMRKVKNILPQLEPLGLRTFILIRKIFEYYKMKKLKNNLTSDEIRTLTKKGGIDLFDEVLHVPLFFCGPNIPSNLIVDELTTGVDVFPTILKLLGINYNLDTIDGEDLTQLFTKKFDFERNIYIESGIFPEQKTSKVIGIRSRNYKYLRSRDNPKKNISLYHLIEDPNEKNNLSSNTKIIDKMEKVLIEKIKNFDLTNDINTLTESDKTKINEELKRMGYVK